MEICRAQQALFDVCWSGRSSQNRLLQVRQGKLLQVISLVSAELERLAEDVDELDRASLSLLLVEPLLMEADRHRHTIFAFAIGICEAHFARAERNTFILDAGYELVCTSLRCRPLLVAVIVETPGERGCVVGDLGRVVLGDVSWLLA